MISKQFFNFVNKIANYRLDINQAHSQAHLDEVVLRELGADAAYLQRMASPRPTELSDESIPEDTNVGVSPHEAPKNEIGVELHKDISIEKNHLLCLTRSFL